MSAGARRWRNRFQARMAAFCDQSEPLWPRWKSLPWQSSTAGRSDGRRPEKGKQGGHVNAKPIENVQILKNIKSPIY